ncbi:23S rRNA (adenine(2030)-N(6))-methyltransferase RlmJ [Azospirillum rugosum]|uniref:Ribosomal RNA large subunit methyltransferase J n=1 Tax=Azospirillum rugosum TaxID=416170 RepID=A0ABS4SDJ3_9PROT|nr:23S rRNA (adenine(2030)-N(6))-methyltransferase RlmJ [Azospirillum rugosum]MBP2290624.1 23S rRNA (adenine2030-N6)-methyltransferase [Azospirillum rugosum]MDQ0525512.1 23S rRNA (adenine2030-N6)-methyltransferase [Azospirillum rugosum]
MNYRHIFHAGNPADVMKHAVLALIIDHLRAKPAPFCVLDAHAGIGRYDLDSEPARKTLEFKDGIGRLFGRPAPHPALQPYLDAVAALNPDGDLRWYPGSPRLARALLRDQDRLVVNELHPDDWQTLKAEFAGDRRVSVQHTDAYHALKANLPPREKRGLVLVDPPFEQPDEFARMAEGLATAHKRWPTGVYALWYPIKERPAVWRFQEAVENTGIRKILMVELTWHPEDTHTRLNGSGLLIVNPPWKLDETLRDMLPALHAALPSTGGGAKVDWLVPEA